MSKQCGYRKCGNLVERRANEKSDKYKARKYCCVSCGHKEQRLRKTLGEKKRLIRVKKQTDDPDHSRFRMSKEEEVGQGAAVIRQILHSFNDLCIRRGNTSWRWERIRHNPGESAANSLQTLQLHKMETTRFSSGRCNVARITGVFQRI